MLQNGITVYWILHSFLRESLSKAFHSVLRAVDQGLAVKLFWSWDQSWEPAVTQCRELKHHEPSQIQEEIRNFLTLHSHWVVAWASHCREWLQESGMLGSFTVLRYWGPYKGCLQSLFNFRPEIISVCFGFNSRHIGLVGSFTWVKTRGFLTWEVFSDLLKINCLKAFHVSQVYWWPFLLTCC